MALLHLLKEKRTKKGASMVSGHLNELAQSGATLAGLNLELKLRRNETERKV